MDILSITGEIEIKKVKNKSTAGQKELLPRVGLPSLINRKIVDKANNHLVYAE